MEERIIASKLFITSLGLWVALMGFAYLFFPLEMLSGIIIGGLLVVANLFLMRRAVCRLVVMGRQVKVRSVIIKFYLCFLATSTIIFILISQRLVNALGLLLGLTVFALTVFWIVIPLAGKIIYRTIAKEAV